MDVPPADPPPTDLPQAPAVPLGVSRRLQALACLGWPAGELGRRLSSTTRRVAALTAGAPPTPQERQAVCALFDQISGTLGPSPRTLLASRERGWSPPLAWDDPDGDAAPVDAGDHLPPGQQAWQAATADQVLVERIASAEDPRAWWLLVPAHERPATAAELMRRGWTQTSFARRLAMSGSTAQRLMDRAALLQRPYAVPR